MSGNPLKDTILDMINDEINKSKTAMMAEVVSYDRQSATIDIKPIGMKAVSSDNGLVVEEVMKKINILNSITFKDQVPDVGDRVYIDFVNGDMSHAVILNILKQSTSSTYTTGVDEQPSQDTQFSLADWFTNLFSLGGGGN